MELNGHSWDECRRHVLSELQRMDIAAQKEHDTTVELRRDIAVLTTSIAILKIKYAIFGGLIGSLPGIVILILRTF